MHKRCAGDDAGRFAVVADLAKRHQLLSISLLDRLFCFVDSCPDPIGECITIDPQELESRELGRHVLQCHRRLAEMGGREAERFASIAKSLAQELGE